MGLLEIAENGGKETAALIARSGSIHRPYSGILLPPHPSHICSEAKEREVTVLVSDLEAASDEEVKVEDRRRFFSPRRWINIPFTRLRVLTSYGSGSRR